MTLTLIRHAHAGGYGAYPDDRLRPLTDKGHKQAQALEKALRVLGVSFDRLVSSPYTRAAETAQALRSRAAQDVEMLDDLTGDDYPQLLKNLRPRLNGEDEHVALVGHEPYLSELSAYLLTGDPQGLAVRFKKGMLVRLEGPLEPGAMTLHSALPPKLIGHLATVG